MSLATGTVDVKNGEWNGTWTWDHGRFENPGNVPLIDTYYLLLVRKKRSSILVDAAAF